MEPEFEYREVGGKVVAHLTSGNVRDERDATDLVGNASFGGAHYVLVDAARLPPEFFDLSSGFAGEVLQKFSNYRLALVVVGERPLLAAYLGFVILLVGLALVVRAETRSTPVQATVLGSTS